MDRLSSDNDIVLLPVDRNTIEQGHQLGDWFVFRDERHFGPLTSKQVSRALLKRFISIDHHIWRPGFSDWVAIREVECFRACGSDTIKNLSDDEFSKVSRLGAVDKVNFNSDGLDLTFAEQINQNVDHIIDDVISQKLLKRLVAYVPEKYQDRLNKAIDDVGISRSEWMFKRASMAMFAITVIVALAFLLSIGSERSFIETLPKDTQNQLYKVSAIPYKQSDPAFTMFQQNQTAKDPFLVGSTNLPLGSEIMIEVLGDPQTLKGSYRFSKIFSFKLNSQIFKTDPIREVTGKFAPAGYYDVFVTCKSCGVNDEDQDLFRQRYLFGVSDLTQYRSQLALFHQETRKSAKLELDELFELHSSLENQYQVTVDRFVKYSRNKEVSAWNKDSVDWLATQKKLIELFEQMKSAEFTSKIYYLELYSQFDKLSQKIFELHVMQDNIMSKAGNKQNVAKLTAEASQQINLNMIFLKSQLDLMNANYSKSKGLPSKAGLNFDDL